MLKSDDRATAPVALTMGDPAGIGPDIALAAWRDREVAALPPFLLIGDPDLLARRAGALGFPVPVRTVDTAAGVDRVFPAALPVYPVPLASPVRPGAPDEAAAPAVLSAIETGVDMVYEGGASALVTNPINKALLLRAGFAHPGHTEFLGELARRRGGDAFPVMMLVSEELRVALATVHIPLKAVPGALNRDLLLHTLGVVADALVSRFGIASPRIAVTGLNPHAGEDGELGREEIEIIGPAIELARAGLKARVSGPYPADTIFQERLRGSYDAVVAMYHDQALVPVKTLAFDRAVNVTLGLPFVRTSPDHGTAYDLAGTGRASATSLMEAIRLAARLAATSGAPA